MSTSAQIEANQTNAQRSTGPRTPEGLAISARNNLRHGLASGAFTVLTGEKQEEFDKLFESLRNEHAPSTSTETLLVEGMAQHHWLSQRALRLQDMCLDGELPNAEDDKGLPLYIRYQVTHQRAFHKCLNDLLKLRAEKRKTEIGFESQKRKRKDEVRKEADLTRREAAENRKHDLHKWRVLLAQAQVDNQELQNMRVETPEHRIHGRIERIIAAEKTA
ncbi:MAG: hypothetical protein ACR2JB_30230 [Bryobacteraceae bacterium]